MKLKSALLLTAVALCATSITWSCKKDTTYVPQLPPETTTGQNTFGCLVNGQVWRNGGVGFPNYSLAISELSENWLIIEARRKNDSSSSGFFLNIKTNVLTTNWYPLDTASCYIYYSLTVNNNMYVWSKEENTFTSAQGFIELTRFDIPNGIVSGRFEATLTDASCGTVTITQGRFDLKQ